MKVTKRKEAKGYEDWVYIFGPNPVAADPIPGNHSRIRVRISELKALQLLRWRRHVSETLHKTQEQVAKMSPVVLRKDVVVTEDLFP